jgi:hypothetical protein
MKNKIETQVLDPIDICVCNAPWRTDVEHSRNKCVSDGWIIEKRIREKGQKAVNL